MSDELISLSDFLDWAGNCATVYGRRSLTLMDGVTQYLMDGVTQDGYERVVTICNEFIACCYIRERYLFVMDMASDLQRLNDELIRRSTLLNMLHKGVDAYNEGMVASLKRAAEYAHGGISADAVVESQNAICYKYGLVEYRRIYEQVLAMPTVGTIKDIGMKGGDGQGD